jgi:hypothetical protein
LTYIRLNAIHLDNSGYVMESDTAITLILILFMLLVLQIVVLFILRRMITNLGKLTNELNQAKHRYAIKSTKELIFEKSFKTCQNCFYRQSFFKKDMDDKEILFYRCKLHGTEIDLKDSCAKFQLESSTQNS